MGCMNFLPMLPNFSEGLVVSWFWIGYNLAFLVCPRAHQALITLGAISDLKALGAVWISSQDTLSLNLEFCFRLFFVFKEKKSEGC